MGYYVGWGTLALINAGLAQGKNKSGLNFFIASLFLGPLATLIIVLSEKITSDFKLVTSLYNIIKILLILEFKNIIP